MQLFRFLALVFCLCLNFTTLVHGQAKLRSPDQVTQELQREALPDSERREHDDYQAAARYWYESRNPRNLAAMDDALKWLLPIALRQSPWVTEVPTWENAHHCQAYHDAGAILLARCYTLLYYGREPDALEGIRLINEKFPHSVLLLNNRGGYLVRRQLRYHIHACALYRAIRERKMHLFEFLPEQDEHDAWAQEKAAEDMAMLRLREGDFESLDHLASQARIRQLKTKDGEWLTDAIYSGMHPLENQSWSRAAWDEMGERIREWRQKRPTSTDARIGELIYTLYRFRGRLDGSQESLDLQNKVSKMIQEIGPVAPQIPFIDLLLSIVNRETLASTAGIFKKAHAKFPDYMPTAFFMLLRLSGEKNGHSLCAATLSQLAESEHPEQMALLLMSLPEDALKSLSAGVKLQHLRNSMHELLEKYPESLQLRNRLGLLASRLGQDDIAKEAMATVGQRWDRSIWKGSEAEASRFTERRPKAKSQMSTAHAS